MQRLPVLYHHEAGADLDNIFIYSSDRVLAAAPHETSSVG